MFCANVQPKEGTQSLFDLLDLLDSHVLRMVWFTTPGAHQLNFRTCPTIQPINTCVFFYFSLPRQRAKNQRWWLAICDNREQQCWPCQPTPLLQHMCIPKSINLGYCVTLYCQRLLQDTIFKKVSTAHRRIGSNHKYCFTRSHQMPTSLMSK